MGLATNPTSLHKTDVECTKSLTPEKKTRKLNRTDFSLRMKSEDFTAAAAKYYKVFPDNAQPDSHQFLQYYLSTWSKSKRKRRTMVSRGN